VAEALGGSAFLEYVSATGRQSDLEESGLEQPAAADGLGGLASLEYVLAMGHESAPVAWVTRGAESRGSCAWQFAAAPASVVLHCHCFPEHSGLRHPALVLDT